MNASLDPNDEGYQLGIKSGSNLVHPVFECAHADIHDYSTYAEKQRGSKRKIW